MGLPRKIVVDSIDEKKQPLIVIRDNGKLTRKHHMPSRGHLMVEVADDGFVLRRGLPTQ